MLGSSLKLAVFPDGVLGNWHVGTESSGAKVKPVAYEPCDSYPHMQASMA